MEVIVSLIKNWGSMVLALFSLVVALISLIKSSKAQKLQAKINSIELIIKENELDKINSEKEKAISSCVEARVIKISNGNYKMKIWNSGNTIVTNVNVELEQGSPAIPIDDKLPFEELEPAKSFELPIVVYYGAPTKFYVVTTWVDDKGIEQSKKQLVSY